VFPLTRSTSRSRFFGLPFSPLALFTAGEQGAWYDPSDLSTLFQNAAGTTPVTGVEQPVRLMLDKSGRGNHAAAPSDAARPVLRGRVNLLERTEEFDNAYWSVFQTTVTANATTAPNATLTADKLIETNSSGAHYIQRDITVVSGVNYTASVYFKKAERTFARLRLGTATNGGTQIGDLRIDLTTETVAAGTTPVGTSYSVTSVGNGWVRAEITVAASGTTLNFLPAILFDGSTNIYQGDGTSGIFIWGADLRVANDGVNLPPYQRVTTSTNYDTAGFPLYLAFDGTDDSMSTSAINLTGVVRVNVFAGVRKLSDASRGIVVDHIDLISLSEGFNLNAPFNSTDNFRMGSVGSSLAAANATTGVDAPITVVASGVSSITQDVCILRLNGAQVASSIADQGAGGYGNNIMGIGARNNASDRFNGRLYSLIVRGAASNAAQIAAAEAWVNGKTLAY
jgi:hypothetical protein